MKSTAAQKNFIYVMHCIYLLIYLRACTLLIFKEDLTIRYVDDIVFVVLTIFLLFVNLLRWHHILFMKSTDEISSMIQLRRNMASLCDELYGSVKYIIYMGPNYSLLTKIASNVILESSSVKIVEKTDVLSLVFRSRGFVWINTFGLLIIPLFIFVASSGGTGRSITGLLLNTHWALTSFIITVSTGLFSNCFSTIYFSIYLKVRR